MYLGVATQVDCEMPSFSLSCALVICMRPCFARSPGLHRRKEDDAAWEGGVLPSLLVFLIPPPRPPSSFLALRDGSLMTD